MKNACKLIFFYQARSIVYECVGGGQTYPKNLDKQKKSQLFKIFKNLIRGEGGGAVVVYL